MATVQQVMDRTLKMLVVAGAEASVSESDSEDFIFALNNFMNQLESKQYTDTTVTPNVVYGIDFGWTTVTSLSDTITMSELTALQTSGAIRGLCLVMADELSADYGVQLSPEMQARVRDGYRALLRLGRGMKNTLMPRTLPIGSGNEDDGANYGSGHFYPIES